MSKHITIYQYLVTNVWLARLHKFAYNLLFNPKHIQCVYAHFQSRL